MSKIIETNELVANDPDLPLLIVNPKSAGGSTRERWSAIAGDFRAHYGPFSVAFTRAPGDGIVLAEKHSRAGRRLIIACGGDGTINEVLNGILQSGEDVEMGIMPAGTGGDFRRSLGLSSTARETAKQLRVGRTERIDVGKVSFLDHSGAAASRYFLNVASFGLSASINSRVKQLGGMNWIPGETIRGKTKFAVSALQEVLETDFKTVRVSIDGRDETTLNTINFCVCNARYFGGGMMIAPDASIVDGQFDVVNIGDIKTARIMLNGYRLYKGTHTELPEVRAQKAGLITVAPVDEGEQIEIETDGELPGRLPATFELIPKALKVRVPSKK